MVQQIRDVFVIGGGINGVGIAADAAGRGLSVTLCEQGDLACGTSQYSSKLIHGGLRYLEQFEFKMVKNALIEREILLKTAPHLVHPVKFIIPNKQFRQQWLIRCGLWLYDRLGGQNSLGQSKRISFKNHPSPVKRTIKDGFSYFDCFTDDARLVIANALRAKEKGALILPYTKCIAATPKEHHWEIQIKDQNNHIDTVYAKSLINATGPWCDGFIKTHQLPATYSLKLVKGSHIILPKLYDQDEAYLLQHVDGRVVFVIPFQQDYTLVGTTDIQFDANPNHAEISSEEITYLLDIVNLYFHKTQHRNDIIHHFSGVRALANDDKSTLSSMSREYKIDVIDEENIPPLIHVFGGKLTGYRKLSEEVVSALAPHFNHLGPRWTAEVSLPGGNLPGNDVGHYIDIIKHQYPFLPLKVIKRLVTTYGTRCEQFLQHAQNTTDLGEHFGHGFYEAELDYLIKEEWALTTNDILWRRTKLGLAFSQKEKNSLQQVTGLDFGEKAG